MNEGFGVHGYTVLLWPVDVDASLCRSLDGPVCYEGSLSVDLVLGVRAQDLGEMFYVQEVWSRTIQIQGMNDELRQKFRSGLIQ